MLQEISEAELLSTQPEEIPESELLAPASRGLVEAKELLPIEDLRSEIDRGEFSPLDYSAQLNTTGDFDKLTSDQQNRLIDAYKYQASRGVTLDAVKRAAKQAPELGVKIVKGAAGVAKRVLETGGPAAAMQRLLGDDTKALDKSSAEFGAAIESGGLDTVEFARGAARKISEKLGTGVDEMTPEQIRQRFFTDLGVATQRQKAVKGQGALAESQTESLRKEGIELDTGAIEDMSILADPTNFVPAVGGLKIVNKLGKKIGFVRGVTKVEQAVDKVTRGMSKATGAVAAAPGKAIQKVGAIAKSRGAQLGALGAGAGVVSATMSGDPENILKAVTGAILAPIIVKNGGELLEQVGKQVSKAGPLAERVANFTLNRAVKPAAAGSIVGGTMAVPLALLAENDDAASSLISGGMAFGAVGNVAHRGAKDAGQALGGYLAEKYQSLGTRPMVESPGYGNPMDEVHSAAIAELAKDRPADANTINQVREAFREINLPDGRKINAEIYLVPEDVKPPELTEEQFNAARPAGFWSGITPEGKARIYLFKDATAVFHEPGHLIHNLIKLADPEAAAALATQVNESFPAPAREAFREAYEKRLYGDVENRPRLSDDQVTNEIVAESFSNMLRGHSLDGLPAPFRQRIAQSLGGFLEVTGLYEPGIKPEGTSTTGPLEVAPSGFSPLGVGHSFSISKLGTDFLSRLGVRVPDESATGVTVETPVQPVQSKKPLASIPVEPKKITAEQAKEDKALKNQPPVLSIEPGVDSRKWVEAEALVKDPAELESLRALRAAVDKPQGQVGPVRSPYFSVIEDSGQSPVERSARRMQQNIAAIREDLGTVPEDLREMVFKTHIPNRVIIRQRSDGTPNINIVGTSVEKIFVNATLAAREAAKAGVALPIATKDGKITKDGHRQLFDALTKYTQNQMNGYAGDGSKVTIPQGYEGDIPPVNKGYTPRPLDARTAQFVNLLQGIEPPRTTARMDRTKRFNAAGKEVTTPRNVEAVRLARESNRPVLEAVNVRPVQGKRPVFRETGETIKELNPLRDEFAQKGVDLSKILHESVEELSLEHFGGAIESVQSPLRGVSTPLATAGFMPKPGEHTEIIRKVDVSNPDEFKAITDKADGGLTGLAYDLGLTVTDRGDLQRLKTLQEKWATEARRLMDEAKQGPPNLQKLLAAQLPVMKAQFFREAWEAATGSGSAVGGSTGIETMRPGFEPPFKGEVEAPSTVKQKAGFMPDPKPAKREINSELESVARKYVESKGITYQPRNDYLPVDENRAKELADWYESAPHEPENPEVQQSYKAFTDETMDQYKALVDAGYKIEPWTADKGEPYKNSSEAVADIRDNKHLWFFPTENGFGTSGVPENHPLLADAGVEINGKKLVHNDLFRAVHDLFGHGLKGNQFGPRGEFNAWRDHAEMYSDAAKPSMSAETLAQNSWVNYGRHLRDASGKIPGKGESSYVPLTERPFAEQKAAVLPAEFLEPAKPPVNETAQAIKEALAPLVEALKPQRENAFMPQTAKGRELQEKGFQIEEAGFTGSRKLIVKRGDKEIASISSYVPYEAEPTLASVDMVYVDPKFRNQGLGETLYRELATRLKQDGITELRGTAISETPVNLRKKVFGDVRVERTRDLGDEPFGRKVHYVSNRIDPNAEFMPALKDNLLDEIKTGKRDGATLNKDGSEFTPGERKLDVVTVASVDIPASELSPETLQRVLEPFAAIIDKPEVKPGVFRIARKGANGEDLISVDVNALVDQKYRDNTSKFASDNNQESFFDLVNFETIPSGGDGRTRLTNPADIARAVDLLVRGEPVDVSKLREGGAFMPRIAYLGRINQGKVEGKSDKGWDISHREQGIGGRERWRYESDHNMVWWSDGKPTEEQVNLVNDWLAKKNIFPTSHDDILGKVRADVLKMDRERRQGREEFMPRREQSNPGLSDVEVRPVYSREEMIALTQPGKRQRFPEAVVPRSENDLVEYDIQKSPRYKKAKTEEAAVKDFADQLEAKYKQYENEPRVQQGRAWYSDFVPAVQRLFGDKAPEFVELLAATSPRNTPKQNFTYATEAFDIWQRGGYDKLIAKFQEGLDKLGDGSLERVYKRAVPEDKRPVKIIPATMLAWWIEKHDLIPKRDNGKLFGMNSTAVLKVITRQWLNKNTGLKTRQFVQNLIGSDHGATIDMWAARTMREIGYKDFQDRWRILSENESPVRDSDFHFSQKVFAEAARRLKMQPDELQAAMWFLEKKLWNDNGWNKAEYGSYEQPLRDLEVRRAGPKQETMEFEVKPKS